MRRRRFLSLTGGSLTALAGCLGLGGDNEDDDTPNPSPTDTLTPTATPPPTPTATQTTSTETPADTPTETETATPDGPDSVLAAARSLVEDMNAGAFDTAYERFAPTVRNNVSPGRLEAMWIAYTSVGGTFDSIADSEEIVQSGYDGVDFTLAFDRSSHGFRVLVNENFDIFGAAVNDEYERPAYVDSSAFETRSTSIETESCIMEADITVPSDDDTVPGVVLVHGSDPLGAADKNLTSIGSKPFKDIAEGLSSRGVAVLRKDRRTHACPSSITAEEYTLDAVSVDDPLRAIERLRNASGVDPDRIAVAGFSLGGMAMPRIVQRDGELAGGIALAAPARAFHEIFLDQYEYLASVTEYEWTQMQTVYNRWKDRITRIRDGDYSPSDNVLGYPGALWDSLKAYDHIGTATQIDEPLYFLQGERDFRVTPEDDFALWQSELSDRSDTDFQSYPGLNHPFQYGEGPYIPMETQLHNPVDSAVIEDMAAWVQEL